VIPERRQDALPFFEKDQGKLALIEGDARSRLGEMPARVFQTCVTLVWRFATGACSRSSSQCGSEPE
jgi:hypothetical protein